MCEYDRELLPSCREHVQKAGTTTTVDDDVDSEGDGDDADVLI